MGYDIFIYHIWDPCGMVINPINFRVIQTWHEHGFLGVAEGPPKKKLDDGWPESVEEQGLLLLVWRRNFRNDI